MAIVRRVGLPENESEGRAITYLAENLPGNDFVLFHNLELPNSAGFPYEYDMILVGERAVYVIEVKHYGGTIQGNEIEWQLETGRIILSPVPLVNKKARILSDRLKRFSPLLSQVFVWGIVVLTQEPVRQHIRDEQRAKIVSLSDAPSYILSPERLPVFTESISRLTDKACEAIMGQFVPLQRRRVVGDYEITETLDNADGVRMLLGRHRIIKSQLPVLLKVYTLNIYAGKQEQDRQRELLTRDAEVLYRVGTHPNIARVVGFFPWEADQFVLAMEWPNLHSLRSIFADAGLMKEVDVLPLAHGILSGLACAHENGVIHRNLRPESVLVGSSGNVKLANFDLARVDDSALATIATRVARLIDTRYAAPEVRADPSTAVTQSDLFSVGQIMREALTGSLKGVVTGDIGEIIGRLTATQISDRYESAASAAEDIAILM